jgi:hypothetical protein
VHYHQRDIFSKKITKFDPKSPGIEPWYPGWHKNIRYNMWYTDFLCCISWAKDHNSCVSAPSDFIIAREAGLKAAAAVWMARQEFNQYIASGKSGMNLYWSCSFTFTNRYTSLEERLYH